MHNRPAYPATASRQLSGVTPSGPLTLGNYLGAFGRFAQMQDRGFYFVADLHALTTPHDPERLRHLSVSTAASFFAAGLDPDRATVFLQSSVRAHAELNYVLEATAHVGELRRMIQFKQKGHRAGARAALFTYPCLMAADILLYDTDEVPVGADQSQHVELCRDLAIRFNSTYGDTFVVPRLALPEHATRVLDLVEPSTKMSKSAPDDAPGVIRVLDGPDVIRRKVRRAVTDSDGEVRYSPDDKPGLSNLIDILAVLTGQNPEQIASSHTRYGVLKQACTEAIIATLAPVRHRHDELLADRGELDRLLAAGALRAREVADPVVRRARTAIGLATVGVG